VKRGRGLQEAGRDGKGNIHPTYAAVWVWHPFNLFISYVLAKQHYV